MALAALVAVFVTLAVLQYRWSQQIAQAASMRMRANLQISINRFREDFDRELSTVAFIFQANAGNPANDRLATYAQRYQSWQRSAAHPKLVSAIYVSEGNTKDAPIVQLTASGFQPAQLPASLERLRAATPEFRLPRPPRSKERYKREDEHFAVRMHREGGFGMFAPGPPWFLDEDTLTIMGRIGNAEDRPGDSWWAVVVLNREILRSQVLKDLADRHFAGTAGLEYRVAVTRRDDPSQVLFTTDEGFGNRKDMRADAVEGLFGGFGGPAPGRIVEGQIAMGTTERQMVRMPWIVRFEPLRHGPAPGGGWEIVVQHRHGSLEAAVNDMQLRNLAISLAVLAILAITTGMLWVTSRRAQRLAQLQMDFVAAVSHELRTPLTVISSAADNIADGVVENRQQFVRYGRVIKAQARQLIDLVEQVLMFASTRQQRAPLHARQVDVNEVVQIAIRNTAEAVNAAGFHMEYTPGQQVPSVMVDPMALAHVLQNLISNAVKYGGDAKWIGIRVDSAPSPTGMSARIHVSDGGAGIPESELARIFEPFYRGEAAAAAQIHGTGLGLAVARAATEAMGGKLAVKSTPGSGSTFTVTLPGVTATEASVAEQPATLPVRGGG